MSYILSLETATTNCSVSLSKDGKTIALKEDSRNGYSHAEKLHIFINDVFKEANTSRSQIDAVAVSKGPGSYTGLRIGVSAAKGLCFALDKPLISLPTLDVLAQQVSCEEGVIIPMLDARRMEVYSAIYDANHHQIRETRAQILDEDAFSAYLNKGKVHCIGSGVEKLKTILNHPNAIFVENKLPSAKEMSALAFEKYKISDTDDVAYFEPYYLKDFIAIKPKS